MFDDRLEISSLGVLFVFVMLENIKEERYLRNLKLVVVLI